MILSTLLESTTKKYKFVPDDTIIIYGSKLTRIRALKNIPKYNISKGDVGGYIEKETNLSHEGDCWVNDNAQVFENALIFGHAKVFENAKVYENARVFEKAEVLGNAKVYSNAILNSASWYNDSTLWLNKSTQKSLDSFANNKQIKNLTIINCLIDKLLFRWLSV